MNTSSPVSGLWGPDGCAAAVSITFDNLGEVTELERGNWPESVPPGQHFSVIRTLPAILRMLDELALSATFFVEGFNVELYPRALQGIVEAGHELAYHAWLHEEWQHLSYQEERQNLERGVSAMSQLITRPYGFRPPGGVLTDSSVKLLRALGFTYCSPAGSVASISDGLVLLPFQWPIVDAYAYLPGFSDMREKTGDTREPLSPAHLHTRLSSELEKAVQNRSYLSLLFHPFVEDNEEYFAAMRSALEELQKLVHAGSIWCVPCHEVAQWMLNHPHES